MNAADFIAQRHAANLLKWGEQNHPDGTSATVRKLRSRLAAQQLVEAAFKAGVPTWLLILREEMAEVACEVDEVKLMDELADVAAVCTAWIESIERRRAARVVAAQEIHGLEPPEGCCPMCFNRGEEIEMEYDERAECDRCPRCRHT